MNKIKPSIEDAKKIFEILKDFGGEERAAVLNKVTDMFFEKERTEQGF